MISPLDLTRLPQTDPVEIYRYHAGLYAVDLLTPAVTEFDFFTHLAVHPSAKGALCHELGIVERPPDVILTLCS